MVEECCCSLTIAAPVWVERLVGSPGGRWEESGVGGEDVRRIVHGKAGTEDGW